MPRTKGARNSSFYHYKVTRYASADHSEILESRFCKTQDEICQIWPFLNHSAIYFIVNPDSRRLKKYAEWEIEKIPPKPIYEMVSVPAQIV